MVQRHDLGPAGFFPRGNVECGPPDGIAKSPPAIIRGRCYGVTKPGLRASGEQGRAGSSKSASGESFLPS